jgi:hypothetical protein
MEACGPKYPGDRLATRGTPWRIARCVLPAERQPPRTVVMIEWQRLGVETLDRLRLARRYLVN